MASDAGALYARVAWEQPSYYVHLWGISNTYTDWVTLPSDRAIVEPRLGGWTARPILDRRL